MFKKIHTDNGRIEIRKNTGEEKKKWKMLKRDYRKRQS